MFISGTSNAIMNITLVTRHEKYLSDAEERFARVERRAATEHVAKARQRLQADGRL